MPAKTYNLVVTETCHYTYRWENLPAEIQSLIASDPEMAQVETSGKLDEFFCSFSVPPHKTTETWAVTDRSCDIEKIDEP